MTYKFKMLFIASIILFSNVFINHCYSQCNSTDWEALQTLYITTYGPDWINSTGWDQVSPITNPAGPPANCDLGTMHGITLDANGRVSEINLGNNNLTGGIPQELSNLVNLTTLAFNNNHMTGTIPGEIGSLVNLTTLLLQDNHFAGSIPTSFANLSNLTQFDISINSLTGCYDSSLASNGGSNAIEPGGTTYIRPQSTILTITDFDPSKDMIDVGTESIHTQIMIDGPNGLVFEHMFNQSAALILEGVFLEDLKWFNFAPIADAHLQQDVSAALAYENCTGLSRPNTVYIRSHEPNLVETVNFDPATDKISFFYLSVRGDQGVNFTVEQTPAGARFYSPYTGQSMTLAGIQFSDLNSSHFEWRANQLEDNVAGRIGLDMVIPNFQIVDTNVFNGKSVPMAGGVDQAPYHIYTHSEYTGSPICDLGNSALCNFSNATISDGNNFDGPWVDFCATGAWACGTTTTTPSSTPLKAHLEVQSADVYLDDANYGVILTSPNGQCFRLKVQDDGSIISESVSCP